MIRILFITCCHVEKFSILTKKIFRSIFFFHLFSVCCQDTITKITTSLAAAVAGGGKHRHGTVHFGPIHGYE